MLNIIVGTAGHIDHGKTSLVRALTGVDTDRLQEEKRRGISIDLGFAHLDLGDGIRAGFVDVPGHERFVRNMLAGATGIDAVLFVVAADESIKPQTREHFDICRMLKIERGVVALTKSDLVDADIAGLVKLEIEEMVAGSFLEGAAVVPVSAVTGGGLDELKLHLAALARSVRLRSASGAFRLPIDRVFTMKGFGTVVTGTVRSGTANLEDELEIHPLRRRVRVRGIETHGAQSASVSAGQRAAINLASIEVEDLNRGMTLTTAGLFAPVAVFEGRVELLSSAPPLKHRAPVHFHAGTAEVEAEIRLLQNPDPAPPGSSPLVRIVLAEPLQLLPGDRFILRRFSPVETIGGGEVIDIAPPRLRRAQASTRLGEIERRGSAEFARLLAAEAEYGLTAAQLTARGASLEGFAPTAERYLVPAQIAALEQRMVAAGRLFHDVNPLLPGIPREELRANMPMPLFEALLQQQPELVPEGDTVRLRTHNLELKRDEDEALARIEKLFADAGLAVPATAEVLTQSGVEMKRAQSLLQILLRDRKLVRVGADLVFHSDALSGLRAKLAARKNTRFSVPEFKDWTGVSRKYAIPLLEFLDRERVTRREGDLRLIL